MKQHPLARILGLLALPVLCFVFLVGTWARRGPDPETGKPKEVGVRPASGRVPLKLAAISPAADPETVSGVPQGPRDEFPPLPRSDALQRPFSARPDSGAIPPDSVQAAVKGGFKIQDENLLLQVPGGFVYQGSSYVATLARGWTLIERPIELEGIGRPMLAYQLSSVQSGSQVLAENTRVLPQAQTEDRTISYVHGAVTERYRLDGDQMEQDFIIRELPGDGGAIRVTGAVSTNLTPPAEGSRGEILTFTQNGQSVLTLSKAVAVDGSGRRLPLELSYAGGHLSMELPADWVSQASLPITIDPVIGTPIVEAGSLQALSKIDLAYNSTRNTWLVVWDTFVSSSVGYNIFAQVLDATGNRVGAMVPLGISGTLNQTGPTVSYAAPVDRWLVAWDCLPPGGTSTQWNIEGALLNGDGSVYKSGFTIDSRPFFDTPPAAAFDGTQWHVSYSAYTQAGGVGPGTVNGMFVSTTGLPIRAADVLTTGTTYLYNFSEAFANGKYVVLWRTGLGPTSLLQARTMDPSGALSAVVTLDTESSTIQSGQIAPGPANTLLIVYSPGEVMGCVTDGNLGVLKSAFPIESGDWASAAYSSTAGEWLAVGTTYSVVSGMPTTSTGPVAGETLAAGSFQSPQLSKVGWNSAANEMMVVFSAFPAPGSIQQLMAVRYQFPAPAVLPAPTGLTATAGNARVTLKWSPVAGAAGYVVCRAPASGGPYETLLDVGNVTTWTDTELLDGTTYYYVVQAYNTQGNSPSSAFASATPAASDNVLFVVGSTTLNSGDAAIQTRLKNLGYSSITIKQDSAAVAGDASGKSLILISSTVNPTNVGTKFQRAKVPLLTWSSGCYGTNLGLTGSATTQFGIQTGQTALTILSSANGNPLAAGLTGSPGVVSPAQTFTWGRPGASALKIATLPSDSTKVVLFAYDSAASLPGGFAAPARRVGFFLESATAPALTAQGVALFNASIRWLTQAPATPTSVTAEASNGSVHLKWSGGNGALTYNILRATSPSGPFTVIKRGLSQSDYTDSGLANGSYYYEIQAVSAAGGISVATSAVTATVQAGGSLVVGVTGPPHLRPRRIYNQFDPVWNQGDYYLYAYIRNGSTFTPATVSSAQWSFTGSSGWLTMFVYTNNPLHMTLSSTQVVTNVDFVNHDSIAVVVNVAGYPPQTFKFDVESSARLFLHSMLRFPQNGNNGSGGPGQTQRQWGSGTPNNFFVYGNSTNDSLRETDRNDFSAWLSGNASGILAQAGIDLYDTLDANLLPLTGGNFNASGEFLATNAADGSASRQFTALFQGVDLPGVGVHDTINIYMVHGIWDAFRVSPLNGITYGLGNATTILVSDIASDGGGAIPEETLAHELMHAIGFPDLLSWGGLSGILNNLKDVIGDSSVAASQARTNPLNWNITRQAGPGRILGPDGCHITDAQMQTARPNVLQHPAKGSDHGLKD